MSSSITGLFMSNGIPVVRMVRNLTILKSLPPLPTLSCRKMAGPLLSMATAIESMIISGIKIIMPISAKILSSKDFKNLYIIIISSFYRKTKTKTTNLTVVSCVFCFDALSPCLPEKGTWRFFCRYRLAVLSTMRLCENLPLFVPYGQASHGR